MLTKSKSILKGLVVVALIAGYGAGTANAGFGVPANNAPTSTTTTTPHSMLSPEPQSKHIATTKDQQSKNSTKTHSASKAIENGSNHQKLNTKQ